MSTPEYGKNGHRDAPRFRLDEPTLKRLREAHADGVSTKDLASRFRLNAHDVKRYVREGRA